MKISKRKYMSFGIDTNHLELDNGDIITGCTEFRYLGSGCTEFRYLGTGCTEFRYLGSGCTEFRYLGSIFTKDGRDTKNVRHMITQARIIIIIISELGGVWWSKDVKKKRKK